MLDKKIIEKQLTYSGYDIKWLANDVLSDESGTNWETITSFLPNDAIIYSLCFGKYLGNDACVIATNEFVYGIFIDGKTGKIISENMKYDQLGRVMVTRSKKNNVVISVEVSNEVRIGLEVENEFVATHMRSTIINEMRNKTPIDSKKTFNFREEIEENAVCRREKIGEIEEEFELEPLNHEHVHRSFSENFKKIRTVYHIRRIIVSLLVLWIPIFGFLTYLIAWRIKLFTINDNLDSNILVLSPTIADIFIIIFSSGSLGCVVFLFVYQKHLRNQIVNALCYILFFLLTLVILSSCVTMLLTVIMAARITNGNESITAEPVPEVIRIAGLFTGIISFVAGLCVFAPLITLNVGIYQDNRVR
jgi:hypothetical protein